MSQDTLQEALRELGDAVPALKKVEVALIADGDGTRIILKTAMPVRSKAMQTIATVLNTLTNVDTAVLGAEEGQIRFEGKPEQLSGLKAEEFVAYARDGLMAWGQSHDAGNTHVNQLAKRISAARPNEVGG